MPGLLANINLSGLICLRRIVRRHSDTCCRFKECEMNESESHGHIPAPLGSVETHAPLLSAPSNGQLLYKITGAAKQQPDKCQVLNFEPFSIRLTIA